MYTTQDNNITVSGWIQQFRAYSALGFLSLNDGSSMNYLQVVFTQQDEDDPKSEPHDSSIDELFEKGGRHVAITCTGQIVDSPASGQDIEMKLKSVIIYGLVNQSEYPISKNRLTLEYLRNYPH